MKRSVSSTLAAVIALMSVAGGAAPSWAQGEPIRIGFIYPDSGPMAQLGLDLRDGFQLYWSEVGGKAGGRPVKVLVETKGSCKADEGLTKARKLVERDGVHVLGGIICTPVAYALRSYVIDKKMPFVVMNAGANELTMKLRSPYIFRSSFSNSDGSHALGEWLAKQGYKKIVLVASDFGGSIEHIGGVARTFTEAGGQVIQEIYPPLGAPDFGPYLAQIKPEANAVVTAVFGIDALRFVKQYAEFGLKEKIPLIGKAITTEDMLPAMGDEALGILSVFHYSAALDTPENKRFVEAYRAKFKRIPSGLSDQGYVGAQMIARALDAVKGHIENQDAFLAALRKVEVDAPRGKVKLDAFQNPVHTIYVFRVEKRDGVLQNIPIASYPNTTQFWKWTPEQFMAMPSYLEMKNKWAK
ncbi:MAG: ABC transporter substrate-binding protein [Candidatus Rokuibacteriota bacterium]|nr:MAG: ABC transporter substrate-binding protein [Candidatus Rokubacteria bacterium]